MSDAEKPDTGARQEGLWWQPHELRPRVGAQADTRAGRGEYPLSLAELEAGAPIFGRGRERRTRCPFCADRPHSHSTSQLLSFNVHTGLWHCHSCGARGLLAEYHDKPGELSPLAERQHRKRRRALPRPLPEARPPSPEELAEDAEKRASLRRLWTAALPIDAPQAAPGAAYLEGRGIPLPVAAAARVRYAADWYGRPSVCFAVQGAAGRLVAAEGRYIDGRTEPKGRSAGPKSRGVFLASPDALEAEAVVVCEGPITALSVAACGPPALALCGHNRAPAWLARRLALRIVFLALDFGETGADECAGKLARELGALGAATYRLAAPAGAGDWNDALRAMGREALRAELKRVTCGALWTRGVSL